MGFTEGTKLGPYEILSQLGAVGMGEVYRSAQRQAWARRSPGSSARTFARDSERTARFQRQAQVLAFRNHPNIAPIYGLEESGGALAVVVPHAATEACLGRLTRV